MSGAPLGQLAARSVKPSGSHSATGTRHDIAEAGVPCRGKGLLLGVRSQRGDTHRGDDVAVCLDAVGPGRSSGGGWGRYPTPPEPLTC